MEECKGCGRIFCGGCIGVEGHYCEYAGEVLTGYVESSYRPPRRMSKRTDLSGRWKDGFKVGQVDSFVGSGTYDIICSLSLQRLGCTCLDFVQRRQFPSLDQRYWHCKHIKKFINDPPSGIKGISSVYDIVISEKQRDDMIAIEKQQDLDRVQERVKELKKERREARRNGLI